MRTIYVMRGLPACGKSTFAAELIKREPGRWVRVNRDDLRAMAVGPGNSPHDRQYSKEREDLVRTLKDEACRQAIRAGYDVILDDTHLVPMTVKKIHTLARRASTSAWPSVSLVTRNVQGSLTWERRSSMTWHALQASTRGAS